MLTEGGSVREKFFPFEMRYFFAQFEIIFLRC